MILPAEEYRAIHISDPPRLHKGLDRVLNFAVGRYRCRSGVMDVMHKEAEQIVDSSLKLSKMTDGKLREPPVF